MLDVRVALDRHALTLRLATDAPRLAIVGPSGAGKSTVLRVFAGLQSRVEGRCAYAGQRWLDTRLGRMVLPERRRVGWVPQDALLFPHVDVRRNLLWGATGKAGRDPELGQSVDDLAASLGIGELLDRRPRHLSGGERQRVAIGRALLARPQLLLLDEPFASLNRSLRYQVAQVLRNACERDGMGLMVVSHNLDDTHGLIHEAFCLDERGLAPAAAPS